MFVPPQFRAPSVDAVLSVVQENPFALLLLTDPAQPTAPSLTHLPLLHEADGTEYGRLVGHVAKGNPAGALLLRGVPAVAVFQGPHAYVSAGWYRDARTVPTWNYVAVHAHGIAEAFDDPAEVAAHMTALTARFEPAAGGWDQATGVDADTLAKLMRGIVAFRLRIDRMDAAFKLSQNRSAADFDRVVGQLAASPHADAQATAAAMRRFGR